MTTYVSNRNSGETDEQGHYRFQTKVWQGNVQNGLLVTQNSPLARNVLVPEGDLKIDYNDYAYTGWSDAAETVAISTADTSNPRIDRIIAYIDRSATLGDTNNPDVLKFVAVPGTPAGSPVKANDAAVNTAVGATNPWCELATVRVEANATTIPNSKITDTRVLVTVADDAVATDGLQDEAVTNEKIAPGVSSEKLVYPCAFSAYRNTSMNTSTPGMGAVVFDAELFDVGGDYDTSNGFFTAPQDGLYQFTWMVYSIASFVYFVTEIDVNGAPYMKGVSLNNPSVTTQFGSGATTPPIYLEEGDTVNIAAQSNGALPVQIGNAPIYTHFSGYLLSPPPA